MDDREVLSRGVRDWFLCNNDVRDPFGRRRKRGEKCKREMADRIAKFGTVRSVPGIDGVECFKLRDAGSFYHAHQIQAGIGNRAGAMGEADEGKQRARGPHFGVIGSSSLERWKGKDDVADRARPDQ
jgi:hypothetical protein